MQDNHARCIDEAAVLSSFQVPRALLPFEVIRVLNEARIGFVLVGSYGLGGWRNKPRATEDVDVVVAARQVRKAVKVLLKAFPNLEEVDLPLVIRLREHATQTAVLDVMWPAQEPYRRIFKHTLKVCAEVHTFRIPSLEMAIVMKFASLTGWDRAMADKYMDAHDFILMVKNNPDYDKDQLAALASLIHAKGGKDVLELARKAQAGEMLRL